MKIDLLIPTRARVKRIYTLLESILDTASDPKNIAVYFYVDEDDTETINAQSQLKTDFPNLDITFKVGPKIVLSNTWNELWKISKNEIIMHAGDDIVFLSKKWDKLLIDEFSKYPDGVLMVYGRDGINNAKLATHSFTSRKVTALKGWFVPPYFAAEYNDTWLDYIYKRNDRAKFIPEIFTDHMHYCLYPQYADNTYLDRRNQRIAEATKIWEDKSPEREEHVEILRRLAFTHNKAKLEAFINENKGKKIYLYGAGIVAKDFIENYDISGLEIQGIIDGNPVRRGQTHCGYKVYHLEDIETLRPDVIIPTLVSKNEAVPALCFYISQKELSINVVQDLF